MPGFSPKRSTRLALTFRSTAHLELVFIYGARQREGLSWTPDPRPLVCMSVLLPGPQYLDDRSFVITLKSNMSSPPPTLFFFKIVLGLF